VVTLLAVTGWEDWTWDESLFAGAAAHYERGRLPYSPGLADAFERALGLDGTGRLLDVGCGPGTVARRLAHLYESVVGLDPDAGMLAEAARLAEERGVENATWVRRRAEELPADLGTFRTVTFAASFHWMDRPLVAAAVRSMLDPGGALVHVDSRHQDGVPAAPGAAEVPKETMRELLHRYLGPGRRAGQSVRDTSPGDEDDVLRAAGYHGPEQVEVPDGRTIERTVDDLVHETLSTSYSAPHLFGDRLAAYVADLRALLAAATPTGTFPVIVPDNQLKIWRPA
jgi:SAM-dependent methyltransferase